MSIQARSRIILIIAGILFGSAFLFLKITGQTVPPIALAAGRAAIASVATYLFLRIRGGTMPRIGKDWIPFLILGVFNVLIPISLMAFAEEQISPGLASILSSTVPIFTVILAHFLTDETFSLEKGIGVVLGFIGVLIVLLPSLQGGVKSNWIPILAVLIAAVLLAGSAIYVRRTLQHISPTQLVVGMTACAASLGLVASLIIENPAQIRPSLTGMLAWLALGIFSAAIAWQLYFWLVAKRGPTFATLIMFLTPPVAVLLGAAFLGSSVSWNTIVGMLVILVSIAIMDGLVGGLLRGGVAS